MLLDVIEVKPLSYYRILVTFENYEKKIFDINSLLNKPSWQELKDVSLFNTVKVWEGTVQWVHGQDICPQWLYEEGKSN